MNRNITTILKTLLYTGIFSTLLPLVFCLLFKRNSKQESLRVILFYILYCIVHEGMSFYLQSIRSENFKYLFYAFTIVEYSFFCYFIYLVISKNKIRKVIVFIWIGFLLFALIDLFYVNKGGGFDSFTSGIESIIILALCAYYLFSQIRGSNSLLIYSTFEFWVVITFLIYFSGTFFLYLMTDKMRENLNFQQLYFIINISFNILKNILLSIAMTMRLNNTIDKQSKTFPKLDDDLFIHTKQLSD